MLVFSIPFEWSLRVTEISKASTEEDLGEEKSLLIHEPIFVMVRERKEVLLHNQSSKARTVHTPYSHDCALNIASVHIHMTVRWTLQVSSTVLNLPPAFTFVAHQDSGQDAMWLF